MITITPKNYVSFKKRVKSGFISTAALVSSTVGFILMENLHTHKPASKGAMATEVAVVCAVLIFFLLLFICGLVIYSQIYILDSIIIDDKKGTIKVLKRKYDDIIDKGEYPIDKKMKVKIRYMNVYRTKVYWIVIKYGHRRMLTQDNSSFSGIPGWTKEMFVSVKDKVEDIRDNSGPYGYTVTIA